MNDFDILQLLKDVASLIARLFGPGTEVVLHDIRSGEIIWIANGEISGRSEGMHTDRFSIGVFAQEAEKLDEHNCIVGYPTVSKGKRPLKASNLYVKDGSGELRYALCVNQDISHFIGMRSFLDVFLNMYDQAPGVMGRPLEEIAAQIILEELERPCAYARNSKRAKMDIIRRLDQRDVFDVRKVMPVVCDMLHISQATLYNYLREIRNTEKGI